MGNYGTGQACRNGHAITGDLTNGDGSSYCAVCGADTISACEACNSPIRGTFQSDFGFTGPWSPPAHCRHCGNGFPWTVAKMEAVKELAEAIEELTDFEREKLSELLPHIVQHTPRTQPAGFKIAAIVERTKAPARAVLRDLLSDITVEAGRKALGL